jgi:hypothetical protein
MSPLNAMALRASSSLRPLAVIALASATLFLSAPVAAASPDIGAAPPKAHHNAKGETVEERISSLHASLKITAEEESNWAAVAQAMRDNDAAMQKLVAARTAASAQTVSAVDDLKSYEQFAQAHVEGLKNLIASFQTLYGTMPDSQKAIADKVFEHAGHAPKPHMH